MTKLLLALLMTIICSCSTAKKLHNYTNRSTASSKQKRSVDEGFDIQAMSLLLNSIHGIQKFPTTIEKSQKIIFNDQEVSAILSEHSKFIQNKIFGKEMIEVKYCHTADDGQGVMTAFYAESIICLNHDGMIGKSDELLKFFLTHEISHFIHEISTQVSSPYNRSLNGNLSAYQSGKEFDENLIRIVGDFHHVFTEEEQQKVNAYIKEYTENAIQAHAEVDTYAYLIYNKLQLKIPTTSLEQFFETWVSEGVEDAPVRLKNLNKYLLSSETDL